MAREGLMDDCGYNFDVDEDSYNSGFKDGFLTAVDEFVNAIEEYYFKVVDSSFMPYLKNVRVVSEANIRHVADQLKEE